MACAAEAENHGQALDDTHYRIRQLTEEDIPIVATICYEAFTNTIESSSPAEQQLVPQLVRRLLAPVVSPTAQTRLQWESQLHNALSTKQRAKEEFWFLPTIEERKEAKNRLVGQYKGRRTYTGADGKSIRPMSRRLRQLFIFVAEDIHTQNIVGCASVSIARPEAALPPPFPTGKPFRCYASNIAVQETHRRRGLGRRLLQQCERIARLWYHDSLWLHVESDNTPALALYQQMGYENVSYVALYGNGKTLLMRKEINLPSNRDGAIQGIAIGVQGEHKVFIWN